MKIRRLVRNLLGPSLKAFVEGPDGFIYEIDYTWLAKEGNATPLPVAWHEAVIQETREADRRRRSPARDVHDFIQ